MTSGTGHTGGPGRRSLCKQGGGTESSLTPGVEEAGKERDLWEGRKGTVWFVCVCAGGGGDEVPEPNTFWEETVYVFMYINLSPKKKDPCVGCRPSLRSQSTTI